MLYIGYLIILDGQNIKKISFGKFYCLRQGTSKRGDVREPRKLHKQVVPQNPLEPPPPTPK